MNTVHVCASRSYDVKIGAGLLNAIGQEVRAVTGGSVLVVTDETVAPLYLAKVYQSLTAAGLRVFTGSVPAGERSKCVEYYVNLLNILAAKNRRDLIADDDDSRDKSRYAVDDILAGIEKRHRK